MLSSVIVPTLVPEVGKEEGANKEMSSESSSLTNH